MEGSWSASCKGVSMTAREILLRVAEGLEDEATPLDAINRVELAFAAADASAKIFAAERGGCAPAWLYESTSRISTIIQQTRKRGATGDTTVFTDSRMAKFPFGT